MKIKFLLTTVVVSLFVFSSCGIQKTAQRNFLSSLQVSIERPPQQSFSDLTRGVKVTVLPTAPFEQITKYTHHLSGKNLFSIPTVNYAQSMGLREINPENDYNLSITIVRADINGFNGESFIELSASLRDDNGKEIYNQGNISASGKNMLFIPKGLNEAYTLALEQIDWYRIASYLRVAQRPEEEPHKKVSGQGDTALEQTIIRWDVQSRPQGADLFWRVVSKTPEVKSTNNKYLNTTPYEATKSLDIKGLDYQTSGNVRIILRCEKDGYLPQEKEFDVRMIIDQEEISAFFRLVKEDETE
ncbi:MAG: hypothetical protein KBS57_03145 [Alistipes sp.]|nr:hypothetical protein [Candidatus Minthomonas equi]